MDKDLYDLPPEELSGVPTVCGSLREALGALDADRDFLRAGEVFTDDLIDGYIDLNGKKFTISNTPPIRSNSRCIIHPNLSPETRSGGLNENQAAAPGRRPDRIQHQP